MKKVILITFLSLFTISCNNKLQEKLGLTKTAPDEFQAKRYKSLEVPPHYELREPDYSKKNNINSNKNNLSKTEKALLKEIEE